jgi:inhibitor of KinA
MKRGWHIDPVGDRCLLVRVGTTVDEETRAEVHALARRLREKPIEGVRDIAPAFTTVALHYRPECFGPQPFARLKELVLERLAGPLEASAAGARVIKVPVCYGGEFGPDLDEVAVKCGLSAEEVIALHLASPHRVHMLGFSPGFPFIGGLDARLTMPRRATPRTRIPPGTVAMARDQTCIYPLETPGGWNLIGRTPLRLFDPAADSPCLLQPGDEIRFGRIDASAYRAMLEARA